jgi:hypothetical protein
MCSLAKNICKPPDPTVCFFSEDYGFQCEFQEVCTDEVQLCPDELECVPDLGNFQPFKCLTGDFCVDWQPCNWPELCICSDPACAVKEAPALGKRAEGGEYVDEEEEVVAEEEAEGIAGLAPVLDPRVRVASPLPLEKRNNHQCVNTTVPWTQCDELDCNGCRANPLSCQWCNSGLNWATHYCAFKTAGCIDLQSPKADQMCPQAPISTQDVCQRYGCHACRAFPDICQWCNQGGDAFCSAIEQPCPGGPPVLDICENCAALADCGGAKKGTCVDYNTCSCNWEDKFFEDPVKGCVLNEAKYNKIQGGLLRQAQETAASQPVWLYIVAAAVIVLLAVGYYKWRSDRELEKRYGLKKYKSKKAKEEAMKRRLKARRDVLRKRGELPPGDDVDDGPGGVSTSMSSSMRGGGGATDVELMNMAYAGGGAGAGGSMMGMGGGSMMGMGGGSMMGYSGGDMWGGGGGGGGGAYPNQGFGGGSFNATPTVSGGGGGGMMGGLKEQERTQYGITPGPK